MLQAVVQVMLMMAGAASFGAGKAAPSIRSEVLNRAEERVCVEPARSESAWAVGPTVQPDAVKPESLLVFARVLSGGFDLRESVAQAQGFRAGNAEWHIAGIPSRTDRPIQMDPGDERDIPSSATWTVFALGVCVALRRRRGDSTG